MKLRTKMLLSQLPLAFVLATVAVYAVKTVVQLSEKAEGILADNYRSVVAGQRIQAAVDEVDDSLLRSFRPEGAALGSRAAALDRLESELVVQEHNVTEEGEGRATTDLRESARSWLRALAEFDAAVERPKRGEVYFERVRPAGAAVKRRAGKILDINQDSMVRKSATTGRFAKEVVQTLGYVSVVALAFAMVSSLAFSSQIARPLVRLAATAREIGEGRLDVSLTPREGHGEVETLVGEFARMTDRLRTYRQSSLGELLEATESAQAAIDSLLDPVIAFAVDGRVQRANEAARTLLGVDSTAPDALASLGDDLEAAVVRARDNVLLGKGPQTARGFENAIAVLIDERPRYFQPVATPISSELDTRLRGVTVLLRDVTTLRRADELKNDLLSTVAHEIRTPLTSIRMAIHLCIEGAIGSLTPKQEEMLAAARDDAERLNRIVEGILSASRIEAGALVGRRQATTGAELVEKAVAPFRVEATDRGVTVEVSVPATAPVEVDVDSVVLVLTNMLSNALRHTPRGGQITASARTEDGAVRFEVADTGSGIPAEHQPRLFEKFYRVPGSPPGGTGLGLSIARDVVFAHDGEIGVESAVGGGSRFWFRLPALRSANTPPASP